MRELVNRFRTDEIPHRLLSTRSTGSKLLTPRQREVFEVASREGYWDVPRRINLTELAGLLNVAKSTLSNQLQRIESLSFMPSPKRSTSKWLTCSDEHVRKGIRRSGFTVHMDNLPKTWDDWIENFKAWQDNVGYDREWMGDFDLSIQFDWERAGDVIEFGDYAAEPSGSDLSKFPTRACEMRSLA